jgi:arsenate reductase
VRILFVCEGNMFRSQVAEKFYNLLTDTNDAKSAGVEPTLKPYASRRAEFVMQEIGMTLQGQYSKKVIPEMVLWADKIIVFSVEQVPRFLGESSKVEMWDIEDIGHSKEGDTVELDRSVRDAVQKKVEELVGRGEA